MFDVRVNTREQLTLSNILVFTEKKFGYIDAKSDFSEQHNTFLVEEYRISVRFLLSKFGSKSQKFRFLRLKRLGEEGFIH